MVLGGSTSKDSPQSLKKQNHTTTVVQGQGKKVSAWMIEVCGSSTGSGVGLGLVTRVYKQLFCFYQSFWVRFLDAMSDLVRFLYSFTPASWF